MTGTEIIKPRPAPAKVLVKPLGTGSRTSAVNAETIMMEVFNLLSERPFSNEQIADSLGQPLSSICARINELKKIDLVVDSGKRTKSKYNKDRKTLLSHWKITWIIYNYL